jgi:selenocysteine-specific elongation factor
MTAELRVVATAGHVDHGKSSLIVRLTGMDPDRFAEEKRRGLTIDLGYAWCALPSGREIGFVDVPGHERFIGNMLAGVGPVRLVLFVVAADEGWKPQSEEHLEIVDVLGAAGGVVAITKSDLVDAATAEVVGTGVRARLAGTPLGNAPIVAVSSVTGQGVDELRTALDALVGDAPSPSASRTRLFVDRVFAIRGAGTVVTGTLGGDCLRVGDEVELYPTGHRGRIRGLQTHMQGEDHACPVTRVAANLAGVDRRELHRGNVLGRPGDWRPTREFDAVLRAVRGLARPVSSRGAFKVHAGAAATDARLRFLASNKLEPGGETFVRIRTARPLVLDVFDRFVLREAGRRETVAGGEVLDPAPRRESRDAHVRLAARMVADRDELPRLLATERGAIRARVAALLTGSTSPAPVSVGDWFLRGDLRDAVERAVTESLAAHHRDHPLEEGLDLGRIRTVVSGALDPAGAPDDADLIEALLRDLAERNVIRQAEAVVALTTHAVAPADRSSEVEALLVAIGGDQEATPPTVADLRAHGVGRDVIDAAARSRLAVRVGNDLVFTTAFVERAQAVIVAAGTAGITVSGFREALGTSRKYAVPLLEWFDQRGVTRRDGDLRFARERERQTGGA